ncbi:MAG: enoyl-CoA hydratase-related protein [Frankia sp.]
MVHLDRDGNVYVLTLGDGENRFNPSSVAALGKVLDEVENADPPCALVTVAVGKFWSNGLDLDWMRAHPDDMPRFMAGVKALFARTLALPVPTVAAIAGHAFGAGAVLALAHDFRVMRADRGYFCLPEVDIQIPFTAGVAGLVQARLTPQVAHEAMTTGRRFGGPDALGAAIVDAIAADGEVTATAVELVRPLAGKDRPTLGAIKTVMYAPVLAALAEVRG